jgi:hypothetical protein
MTAVRSFEVVFDKSAGLKHRSAAARLLKLWFRIPPVAWMFVANVACCQGSLRRANRSSRGVVPTVFRRRVWCRNLKTEGAMTRIGTQHLRKKIIEKFVPYVISRKTPAVAVVVVEIQLKAVIILSTLSFVLVTIYAHVQHPAPCDT